LPDEEDDFDFEERFIELRKELAAQIVEENLLNDRIQKNLERVNINA